MRSPLPQPRRILVVEDEPDMGAMIQANLETEGFSVTWVQDGEACIQAHAAQPADLVVLDLMLPGMDGSAVLRTLRRRNDRVPVIILTARSGQEDRLSGLSDGADDYLTKPFAILELVARIRAILRRIAEPVSTPRALRSGPFRFDFLHLTVARGRTDLAMTLREFRILEVLIAHPGRVHSRQDLVDLAWDKDARPTLRTVDKHIEALRRKLGDTEEHPVIQTLEREGYRWMLPVKS